ncbi:MAG: hypothetical protein M1828_004197 [Chrysothrix sp. TS-e1954]|nr:MAG: hypothetical protein M1828_004197 [Chrysothrix sp. TS-e1954]
MPAHMLIIPPRYPKVEERGRQLHRKEEPVEHVGSKSTTAVNESSASEIAPKKPVRSATLSPPARSKPLPALPTIQPTPSAWQPNPAILFKSTDNTSMARKKVQISGPSRPMKQEHEARGSPHKANERKSEDLPPVPPKLSKVPRSQSAAAFSNVFHRKHVTPGKKSTDRAADHEQQFGARAVFNRVKGYFSENKSSGQSNKTKKTNLNKTPDSNTHTVPVATAAAPDPKLAHQFENEEQIINGSPKLKDLLKGHDAEYAKFPASQTETSASAMQSRSRRPKNDRRWSTPVKMQSTPSTSTELVSTANAPTGELGLGINSHLMSSSDSAKLRTVEQETPAPKITTAVPRSKLSFNVSGTDMNTASVGTGTSQLTKRVETATKPLDNVQKSRKITSEPADRTGMGFSHHFSPFAQHTNVMEFASPPDNSKHDEAESISGFASQGHYSNDERRNAVALPRSPLRELDSAGLSQVWSEFVNEQARASADNLGSKRNSLEAGLKEDQQVLNSKKKKTTSPSEALLSQAVAMLNSGNSDSAADVRSPRTRIDQSPSPTPSSYSGAEIHEAQRVPVASSTRIPRATAALRHRSNMPVQRDISALNLSNLYTPHRAEDHVATTASSQRPVLSPRMATSAYTRRHGNTGAPHQAMEGEVTDSTDFGIGQAL